MLGWVVISPGRESSMTNMMFSKTLAHDYENLYSSDVLGVIEEHVRRDEVVYDEFKQGLMKRKHPPLDTNKTGSLGSTK